MNNQKVCEVCGDVPLYCKCFEEPLDMSVLGSLEQAIELAVTHHKGQKDKAGKPYILHPLRVLTAMETEEEQIVAVLHDVVEDTVVTIEDLKEDGFSENVLRVLRLLTKKPDDEYFKYVKRIANNAIARKVKLADLEDNMDLSRLPMITDDDRARLIKYKKARSILLETQSKKKPKVTLKNIDNVLMGKIPQIQLPNGLEPKELHALYHYIKSSEDETYSNDECFSIWEDNVIERIAVEFFKYKPRLTYKIQIGKRDRDLNKIRANEKILNDAKQHFLPKSHEWIYYSAKLWMDDLDHLVQALNEFRLSDEYLFRHYEEKEKDFRNTLSELPDILNEYGDITADDLHNRYIEELKDFFPYLSFRYETANAYKSSNEFAQREFNSTHKASVRLTLRQSSAYNRIKPEGLCRQYPFPHIMRTLLYFWLEQSEPNQNPDLILNELIGTSNIGKYDFDAFLVWLWEVVTNSIIYNDKATKKQSKQIIIEQLKNIYSKVDGKNHFDGETLAKQWDKFNKLMHAALRRVKSHIDDSKDSNKPEARLWFSEEKVSRLEGIISEIAKSLSN